MPTITERNLFNFNISEPTGLSELIERLEDPSSTRRLVPELKIKTTKDDPPMLLYVESRGANNRLYSMSWYGGNGSDRMMFHSGARQTLELNSKYFTSNARGAILNYFCQIEFCMEALVCVAEGVFSTETTFSAVNKKLHVDGGSLSTTDRKIRYLRKGKYIQKNTADLLYKAKNIRNVISHQFLIQNNLGLSNEDLQNYDTPILAIELIFSAAWVAILNDYSKHQIQVAEWLLKKCNP